MGTTRTRLQVSKAPETDNFMKIDGIEGESQDSKHKNEIEILATKFKVVQPPTTDAGGGQGAGIAAFQDCRFVKRVDKSSPKLLKACSTGEHLKKAVLTYRKAGKDQQDYMVVTFSDVLITGYDISFDQTDKLPTDEFGFDFSKVEIEYKPQKADGTVSGSTKAGFDMKQRKKI